MGFPAGKSVSEGTVSGRGEVLITVEHMTAELEGNVILKDVSFEVYRGEILVIMGRSGSGKSVLLKHMIGLYQPARGEVLVKGVNIHRTEGDSLRRVKGGMGILFQASGLLGSMTLGENVALPLREYRHLSADARDLIVRMKLGMVNLAGCEELLPAELSGGMKKRAGLARAMVLDPEMLFFDEPSAGLDPVTSVEIDTMIVKINQGMGTTMVIVSHELQSILNIAHRVIMLDQDARGIIAQGNPRDLKDQSPDHRVINFLNRKSE